MMLLKLGTGKECKIFLLLVYKKFNIFYGIYIYIYMDYRSLVEMVFKRLLESGRRGM